MRLGPYLPVAAVRSELRGYAVHQAYSEWRQTAVAGTFSGLIGT
jgi:hypothetical protein